ncbi:MAG: secondary thiamine-phosphate synthase enzyme YjbQ [candidate division NC10 bacterium]|nr:secondary thiamine-phosphate synthase enzyme YjbQ [candidate division NC10 bacterium]
MADITLRTRKTQEMIDITQQVADEVRRTGVKDGLCLVFVPHATAAVVINENADPNVCQDILDAMGSLVPEGAWRHDRIDNNAAAHIKATILGPSETVPVRGGVLRLGTWQSLMLVEFDGPRDRTVIVEVR